MLAQVAVAPQGGAVTIRAEVDPGNAEAALVSVEDTGCGLAPEDHERVFEPLYQVPGGPERSRDGLGLGLPISRELVLRHGGRMWVESEPGKGSTFRFTLPLYDIGRLVDPLLTPRNRQRGSLALLRVEVAMRDSAPRRTMPGDPLGAAWRVVVACTTPSMDVVLPRIGADARSETFHVAAMADEHGARILARRIDEQLGASAECGPEHCFWSITTTLLPIPPAGIVLDRAALLVRITEHLDSRTEVHRERRAA